MTSNKKLPIILQSEIAECGLACLVMMFNYHRYPITLAELRRKIKSTAKGVTISQLKCIAEDIGFVMRVLRVECDQLSLLTLPCVMHWDFNHFVVLQSVKNNQVVVYDPLKGCCVLTLSCVSDHFSGIALEVLPTQLVVPYKRVKLSGVISKAIKSHYPTLLKLLALSVFIQLCSIGSILYIQKGIDSAVHALPENIVILLLGIFFAAKILEYAVSALRQLMLTALNSLLSYELGFSIMKHLLLLPVSFFENRHMSDILSRFNTIEKIRSTLTEGLVEGFVDGLMSLIVLVMMFSINIKISLIALSVSAIYFVSKVYYNSYVSHYHEKSIQFKSMAVSCFLETLRSVSAIKVFAKEVDRLERWQNKFTCSINQVTKIAWHKIFFDSVKHFILSIELFLSLMLSCILLSHHQMSLGVLYAYLAYRLQFFTSISNLADKIQDFHTLTIYIKRLDDITLEVPEQEYSRPCIDCALLRGGFLEIQNVSFAYAVNDAYMLTNINFQVKSGEYLVITGPSGCGKSSLLKVMLGLLSPTKGCVYWHARSIHSEHMVCYRKKIAAVMQDDALFSGTIIENISFFEKSPDINHVLHCASIAGIMTEINAFPMGFYTLIGDAGSVLSGGQKQRVLLARALYARPEILFLDEAASHLDEKKEREINIAIKSLGITVIAIAHRRETISAADKVISLAGGVLSWPQDVA